MNAEKLLSKLLGDTLGHKSSHKGKKPKKSGLMSALASGQGLMTVIGLGVGAYEIWRSQKNTGIAAGLPPSAGAQPAGSIPPLPPTGEARTASPPPIPPQPAPPAGQEAAPPSEQELATCFIRVMIAAAHADGSMDEQEEKAILDRLRGSGLENEERLFLINELHHPKAITELTAGITDPATARALYLLACETIEIDTAAERQWLDELGKGLGLSIELQRFLAEQAV